MLEIDRKREIMGLERVASYHRGQGIVMHYHSQMSEHYLQSTHNTFTTPDGKYRILVSTSGQSVVRHLHFQKVHFCSPNS